MISWKVPLFDIDFGEREVDAARGVIRSGWLTMGRITADFERRFADFLGAPHAIAVGSGTAALHLAHLAVGVADGDEVICPSFTFVACANAILYAGGRPVFADIAGFDDFTISPADIEAKITERTKAIQVVHYAGRPCDMEAILKLAGRYGLSVIEDCSHAPGADYKGGKCGTMGDVGCFSFFPNKNMATAEGGMVATRDDETAAKIRSMRSHGMTSLTVDRHRGHAFSYDVVDLGFNYRIDEIRSAIGIVQLEKLVENNTKRSKLARLYQDRLDGLDDLGVPFKNSPGVSSHHILPVLLSRRVNREDFMTFLKDRKIQTSIHYPPIHTFDYYRRALGARSVRLPVTEEVAKREVTLPLYPSMGEEAVHFVCDAVADYFRR